MRIRSLVTVVFFLLPAGCRNTEDSRTSSLSGGLKPEGFLVIKDIAPDPAASGSFLVTCASSTGDKKSSVSQADIEANKVCLPVVASGGGPPTSPSTSPGSSPTGASGYSATNTQRTYLKARPALDVTAAGENLKVGVDFCVIEAPISASNICKYSDNDLKITGLKETVPGCNLKEGYVFPQHFSVSPSVSACRSLRGDQ